MTRRSWELETRLVLMRWNFGDCWQGELGSAAWAGHHGVPDGDEGEARERCLAVGDEQ